MCRKAKAIDLTLGWGNAAKAMANSVRCSCQDLNFLAWSSPSSRLRDNAGVSLTDEPKVSRDAKESNYDKLLFICNVDLSSDLLLEFTTIVPSIRE